MWHVIITLLMTLTAWITLTVSYCVVEREPMFGKPAPLSLAIWVMGLMVAMGTFGSIAVLSQN